MFRLLVARITIFALACVWVFGWLLGGIALAPYVVSGLENSGLGAVLASFLAIWYLATLIVVGSWVGVKGFKFVGRWEKDSKVDTEEEQSVRQASKGGGHER